MDLQEAKHKAVGMLLAYKDNTVQIKMLQAELQTLSELRLSNMAVNYDQPPSGCTNKVCSPVEAEILQIETRREQLQNEIALYKGMNQRIDIALNNMSPEKRTLLQLKYVERKYWKQVCQYIPYSEEYIRKELKESAIETLAYCLFPELYKENLFSEVLKIPGQSPAIVKNK